MNNINYAHQSKSNIGALVYHKDYSNRFRALKKIVPAFNKEKILYAFTCSFGLFLDGIVDDFHDFDILVAPQSFEAVCDILSQIGNRKTYDKDPSRAGCFRSIGFAEFEVDGIDVDVICEFGFTTFDSVYQYHFRDTERHFVRIGEMSLPVVQEEAQFIFYAMMTGWQAQRAFKRDLVAHYLKTPGNAKQKQILENALDEDLPFMVKARLQEILEVL